ncbi:MAG: hypothetical protein QOF41_2944 [Methylobacteriaceae bacterium]|nr:hypothetical protein [Methylobacteriaceae bacterium]
MSLLPLAFSAPLALIGLALLPVIYYLLRITPPRPRQIPFPPLKLILDIEPKDETPARTPWWLLALRLLIAGLVVLAMAGPIWNPQHGAASGQEPLLVLVDDGWPAAPTWEQRLKVALAQVDDAARQGAPTAVLAASEGARDPVLSDGSHTAQRLRALKPVPYTPDRMGLIAPLEHFFAEHPRGHVAWIADGLALGQTRPFAEKLAEVAKNGQVEIISGERSPVALAGAANEASVLNVNVLRATKDGPLQGRVRALDLKGVPIGDAAFDFAGATETQARFDLPIELRNDIARLEIASEHSAGAVTLLDERWKRRRVGVVSGASTDVAQPLLAPSYYLQRALQPFADVREARAGVADPIDALLDDNINVMLLADVGVVAGLAHDRLESFVEDGGVLVRFAGTRLAGSSDDLVPVALRRGGRTLGGSLSWETPKKLAPFDRASPFFGLSVPEEVTVTRQVLAEPEAGLPARTWAALADGTPLVTAEHRGKGMIVLFHVTADTTWSNLPLSGLFVDMLRKILAVSADTSKGGEDASFAAKQQAATLAPLSTLDGFGALGPPPSTAKSIPANFADVAGAEHPPGFYGPPDALVAVNPLAPDAKLEPADFSGLNFRREPLNAGEPIDLRPWLIAGVIAFLIADALASLWLSGGVPLRRRRAVVAAFVALFTLGATAASFIAPVRAEEPAQQISPRDLESVLTTRLAYVVTGDAQADEASRAGLASLTRALAARTSLTPGEPVGVDPARDELVFYPMIYWPIVAGKPLPPQNAINKIATFMKQGGTIVFDTRDALASRPGGPLTPEARWLRDLLAGVDVPELEPVPQDHVITKTFYLLDGFIGRTTIGQTWVEALPPEPTDGTRRPARAGDSVSPIVITSNDLAAAWAADRNGEPLYPLVPGGVRQRELALRGGINLVMYTLTGNYKSDQVHVRDLLDRLGH